MGKEMIRADESWEDMLERLEQHNKCLWWVWWGKYGK